MMSDPIEFPVRLQKYLAACGLGSRRTCEQYIADGDVSVNGKVIETPGVKVESGDVVCYRGMEVNLQQKVYYILNKPEGYLSSNADPHHDRFARELITVPEMSSLFHVGRLDLNSTGLIIYTNDGEFSQRISHPSFEIEKEYVVNVKEPLNRADFAKVKRQGVMSDGERLHIRDFRIVDEHTIHLILGEGKNREIRRICRHFRYHITRLHRIRIGRIRLGNLASGSYRKMDTEEINTILKG